MYKLCETNIDVRLHNNVSAHQLLHKLVHRKDKNTVTRLTDMLVALRQVYNSYKVSLCARQKTNPNTLLHPNPSYQI